MEIAVLLVQGGYFFAQNLYSTTKKPHCTALRNLHILKKCIIIVDVYFRTCPNRFSENERCIILEAFSEFMSGLVEQLSAFKEIIAAVAIVVVDVCAILILCFCRKEKKAVRSQWEKAARHVVLQDASGSFSFAPCSVEILMGRHISADLRFNDMSVSRYHAILSLEEGIWTITDLGSTTGTFVNGARVRESRKLRLNDEITIGKKSLYLRRAGS